MCIRDRSISQDISIMNPTGKTKSIGGIMKTLNTGKDIEVDQENLVLGQSPSLQKLKVKHMKKERLNDTSIRKNIRRGILQKRNTEVHHHLLNIVEIVIDCN